MLQDVLADDPRAGPLTPTDQRGLTLLFRTHVRPYGEVHLDLAGRLELGRNQQPAVGITPKQIRSVTDRCRR